MYPMKIIDAHSHIDYITSDFQDDVVGTICCATNESGWAKLIGLVEKDRRVYGAFGIHPWFIGDIGVDFEKRLYDLLKSNDSFMVGEIGLDKYKPDMDKQIEIFQKQFDIAVKLNRAVFLHCVGAWDKILHILKQYNKSKLPIIIAHDFTGSDEILDNLIKNYDMFFSIHKIDKNHEINRIEQIPINRILVETDAKPDIVLHNVIDKISKIKNESNADKTIYENTLRILNNGQIA